MATIRSQKDLEDILVPSKILEKIFNVKDRTVRHLADIGIIKRDAHGKYLLMESVRNYILALKTSNFGKEDMDDDQNALDLDEERAAHEHIKRQISEIKLQLVKGQVHKAEDVEAVMTDMFAKFKSKMAAVPAKMAKRLENKSRTEIQAILKREIDNTLCELADYNPSDFYSDEHIEIPGEAINMLKEAEDGE